MRVESHEIAKVHLNLLLRLHLEKIFLYAAMDLEDDEEAR